MTNSKTRCLVEGAIMIALAAVLSYIRIIKLPWGGSITLLSMLPIVIFSIKRGVKQGLVAALIFSLIQLGQGIIDGLFGWGLTVGMLIACIFIDYIGAYTIIGIGGIFRNKGLAGWVGGTALAIFIRFSFHFISGIVIWKSYGELWSGFSTDNSYLYSLLYNGAYMLPELIFTVVGAAILFKIPQIKKLIVSEN
ncbi:MAG TPA: energy-coupled thiamine transporter ThiT [Oscillospiraceae bacterium]|nr:energy-coupled thiamine transporter ThiT [Oscillospiraceae bacterium]